MSIDASGISEVLIQEITKELDLSFNNPELIRDRRLGFAIVLTEWFSLHRVLSLLFYYNDFYSTYFCVELLNYSQNKNKTLVLNHIIYLILQLKFENCYCNTKKNMIGTKFNLIEHCLIKIDTYLILIIKINNLFRMCK